MGPHWKEKKRPPRLECKYLFADYDALRDFLDDAAELSEQRDFYPDMGFGRDYVNITIHPEEGEEALGDAQREFADLLDGIGGYLPAE